MCRKARSFLLLWKRKSSSFDLVAWVFLKENCLLNTTECHLLPRRSRRLIVSIYFSLVTSLRISGAVL